MWQHNSSETLVRLQPVVQMTPFSSFFLACRTAMQLAKYNYFCYCAVDINCFTCVLKNSFQLGRIIWKSLELWKVYFLPNMLISITVWWQFTPINQRGDLSLKPIITGDQLHGFSIPDKESCFYCVRALYIANCKKHVQEWWADMSLGDQGVWRPADKTALCFAQWQL